MTRSHEQAPDLFTAPRHEPAIDAPLAERMRPRDFDDFVGQDEIVSPDRPLRKAIETDQLSSVIFWGPPGSGKTTLAHLIARYTKGQFVSFSAVTGGVPELRTIIKAAEQRRLINAQRTILFVDEIHRFNKAQQDAFLPHVERGTIILVGATTENPSFEVISPLLSRSILVVLKSLSDEALGLILDRALNDSEGGRTTKGLCVVTSPSALGRVWQRRCEGDADGVGICRKAGADRTGWHTYHRCGNAGSRTECKGSAIRQVR